MWYLYVAVEENEQSGQAIGSEGLLTTPKVIRKRHTSTTVALPYSREYPEELFMLDERKHDFFYILHSIHAAFLVCTLFAAAVVAASDVWRLRSVRSLLMGKNKSKKVPTPAAIIDGDKHRPK